GAVVRAATDVATTQRYENPMGVANSPRRSQTAPPRCAPRRGVRMGRRVGVVEMFTAAPDAALASTKTDTNLSAQLSGGMMNYDWKINGRPFADTEPITIRQ